VRAAAAVLAGAVLALAGCSGTSTEHPASPSATSSAATRQNAPDPTTGREDALAALLRARATAVLHRDRDAFAASLDSQASGFGLRQLAMFDALAKLPLGTFSYGTPEPAPALGAQRAAQVGPGAWVSRVAGHYSLAGFDTAERDFESYFTVVHRADGWRLADDTDGGTQPQVWDLPRLSVLRGPTVLVVGTGPASRLRPYLQLGTVAVDRVSSVWTAKWNHRLVLVVPGTSAQMAEQLGQSETDVDQVAAVTDGPFDPDGRAGADRVVVNPGAFAKLQERGKQVVVAHEATHVAVRAGTDRPVPLWLSEGMADYVGYQHVGATRQQVAAALLDRVRHGKGPKALPSAGDFDPGRTTIAPSYNAAWLAVCHLVDRWGQDALVRLYLAAATKASPSDQPGDPDANTAAAFESVLHTSEAAFTKSWLGYLHELAGAAS
jgi:hypothetical protein